MMPFAQVKSLVDGGTMQAALRSLTKMGDIAITFQLDNQQKTYSSRPGETFSSYTPLEIGCIAKTLTAVLMAIAVSERKLSYSDAVEQYFPYAGSPDASLRVFHLLNQSHGLDSTMAFLPRSDDGLIDAETLWYEVTKTPALAHPGAFFYNYGTAGTWLASAILERIYGVPFWDLLRLKVLTPVGTPLRLTKGRNLCPANGGISLSGTELLQICRLHLGPQEQALQVAIDQARCYQISVPAWPPTADGACPGWFCHGKTYTAYGNRRKVSSLMLLISPIERAAIVIGAQNPATIYLAQRALFPVIFNAAAPAPRPLTKTERQLHYIERYVGRYRNAIYILDVTSTPAGELYASIYRRDPAGVIESELLASRKMLPAVSDTLYPVPPDPMLLSFVRFFGETSNGACLFAATDKHLFRRAA